MVSLNRGYRVSGHDAPLRENLAAAIALNMPKASADMAVIDSMSGSGTFLIESFLLNNKISPQYLRINEFLRDKNIWSFNHFPVLFKNKTWMQNINNFLNNLAELDQKNLDSSDDQQFFGHDINLQSVNIANDNLKKAKLFKKISIKKSDGTKIKPETFTQGIVFCNPPYGERLGQIQELEELYYQYGKFKE